MDMLLIYSAYGENAKRANQMYAKKYPEQN